VPPDLLDLDGDGNTAEPLPRDREGFVRFHDDTGVPDTGAGTPPIVDMGAFEFGGTSSSPPCPGDIDGDRQVTLSDLAILLSHFGTPSGATLTNGDLDADGDVDLADLAILLGHFGATCG
jgi:hypothetical protein